MVRLSTVLRFALLIGWLVIAHSGSMADDATIFQKPVRLQADGRIIDTGDEWGHSGPCLADVDGNGLCDLVVGDFSGKFRIYRNIGASSKPTYAAVKYLMAGTVEARVPIYCCVGSSPHFADLDGDGKLDLISGSYDPGECYLFRGLGDGKFAKRETIVDKNGKPVLRRPDQKQKYQSFGSWPVTVDWDHDGDLDLLIGALDGTMFVRLNEGSRSSSRFSAMNLMVQADGKELTVPDRHAAPAVADWDGDGRWDILSGSVSGAVYLYRNVGELGHPRFEAERLLVAKHKGNGYDELVEPGAEPMPGIHSQIAAADYNGDGKIDLLVGDFCTNVSLKPGLTAADREKIQTLRKQITEAPAGIEKAAKDFEEDFVKRYPGDEINSDKATAEYREASRAIHESKEFKEWKVKSKELNASLARYFVKATRPGATNEHATTHGYVWLFLRR